jgi:hypothetical protein
MTECIGDLQRLIRRIETYQKNPTHAEYEAFQQEGGRIADVLDALAAEYPALLQAQTVGVAR